MKKLILILAMIASVMTVKGQAPQTCNYDPISQRNQWYDDSCNMLSQYQALVGFQPRTGASVELNAAHSYTVQGNYIVANSATNKDTLIFKPSLYNTGQIFYIKNTGAANDTTYLHATSGTIDASTWYIWGLAPYRSILFWYDGTNFWTLASH